MCVCEGVGRWYARGLHQVEREGVGLGHDQPRLDVVEQLADVELGGAVEELVAAVEEVDPERALGRVGLRPLRLPRLLSLRCGEQALPLECRFARGAE